MDDEVYLLRREVAGLRAENARLRALLCEHDFVLDTNWSLRCSKCDRVLSSAD